MHIGPAGLHMVRMFRELEAPCTRSCGCSSARRTMTPDYCMRLLHGGARRTQSRYAPTYGAPVAMLRA